MKYEVMVLHSKDRMDRTKMGIWITDHLQLKYLQDWKYELTHQGYLRYLFTDEQAAIMFSLKWV